MTCLSWKVKLQKYQKNIFTKRRTMATHLLIFMVSDELHNRKPYAITVPIMPVTIVKDKVIRNLQMELKRVMNEMGMIVVDKNNTVLCVTKFMWYTYYSHTLCMLHACCSQYTKVARLHYFCTIAFPTPHENRPWLFRHVSAIAHHHTPKMVLWSALCSTPKSGIIMHNLI